MRGRIKRGRARLSAAPPLGPRQRSGRGARSEAELQLLEATDIVKIVIMENQRLKGSGDESPEGRFIGAGRESPQGSFTAFFEGVQGISLNCLAGRGGYPDHEACLHRTGGCECECHVKGGG